MLTALIALNDPTSPTPPAKVDTATEPRVTKSSPSTALVRSSSSEAVGAPAQEGAYKAPAGSTVKPIVDQYAVRRAEQIVQPGGRIDYSGLETERRAMQIQQGSKPSFLAMVGAGVRGANTARIINSLKKTMFSDAYEPEAGYVPPTSIPQAQADPQLFNALLSTRSRCEAQDLMIDWEDEQKRLDILRNASVPVAIAISVVAEAFVPGLAIRKIIAAQHQTRHATGAAANSTCGQTIGREVPGNLPAVTTDKASTLPSENSKTPEEQIVVIVKRKLKDAAPLTRAEHAEFWRLMNSYTPAEQANLLHIVRVNLLGAAKFHAALIESAAISASNGKVVKTAELIELTAETRRVFLTTLPASLAPAQRENLIKMYDEKRVITDRNNDSFLLSAAAGKPHTDSEQRAIATDSESLRTYPAVIKQGINRVLRLIDPIWKDETTAQH